MILKLLIVLKIVSFVESQFPIYRPPSEHCKKYCFVDCYQFHEDSRYWPPSFAIYYKIHSNEFNECINANSHCDCATRATFRNPLLILGVIIIGVVTLLAIIHFLHKYIKAKQSNRLHENAVLSRPITSSVPTIYSRGTSRTDANISSPYNPAYMDNPAFSNCTNDAPPDYLPPPSYQECSDYFVHISNEKEIKKDEKS